MNKNNPTIKMQTAETANPIYNEEAFVILNLNNVDEYIDKENLDTPEGLLLIASLLEENQDNDSLVSEIKVVSMYRKLRMPA